MWKLTWHYECILTRSFFSSFYLWGEVCGFVCVKSWATSEQKKGSQVWVCLCFSFVVFFGCEKSAGEETYQKSHTGFTVFLSGVGRLLIQWCFIHFCNSFLYEGLTSLKSIQPWRTELFYRTWGIFPRSNPNPNPHPIKYVFVLGWAMPVFYLYNVYPYTLTLIGHFSPICYKQCLKKFHVPTTWASLKPGTPGQWISPRGFNLNRILMQKDFFLFHSNGCLND